MICLAWRAFGFQLARIRGSHHILVHLKLSLMLNLQPAGRRAKRYQVRQLMSAVQDNGLKVRP
jgi:predicted RNA binding protein YcfA (HicA-like mRNA interferase family)